ncbi:transient receptor potential cation channel protein painless-like [Lucilia sericata]|uniref:transient receptor potential cation channel protein painless-like n=1 Tax=Lucilia sericata TaxID=13632 RepID=UPI0018A84471|nr:transient receptor potential cation channel protein painless-like [Lucilia sericata]
MESRRITNYRGIIALISKVQANNEIQLYEAFLKRNICKFCAALEKNENPFKKLPDQDLCVFYQALQTPGCSAFIKESLKAVFHIPKDPYFFYKATKFACNSEDPDNFEALCSYKTVVYMDLFLLDTLTKKLNNDNVMNLKQFIQYALRFGVSPNIAQQEEITPLHNVIENIHLDYANKWQIIQIFLLYPDIDIDTFRQGEVRNILERDYPNIKLPERITTIKSLKNCLKSSNIKRFNLIYSEHLHTNSGEDVNNVLLLESIVLEEDEAFDIIFRILKDNVPYESVCLFIQIAYETGNARALYKLLTIHDIKLYPNLFKDFVNYLFRKSRHDVTLYNKILNCFYFILDFEQIDINELDYYEGTALHRAIQQGYVDLTKILLKKGANLCIKHDKQQIPLISLPPAILEEHLDDCITTNWYFGSDPETTEIKISFKNFNTKKWNVIISKQVLPAIACMAKSPTHRYLLQHPVISSILHLKWQKASYIFYTNFYLCLFFIVSIITHIILNISLGNHETAVGISLTCSCLGMTYLFIRECIQFVISPWKYLKCFRNYMEILLIIFAILSCLYSNRDLEVACILLLAYELFCLVGSLPIAVISTHMLMLETVCISFIKSFLFYSIFIFTFTLCFYIKSDQESDKASVISSEEEFNRFSTPMKGFFKTIVMFIGEIDASNLNLDSSYSLLLFLSFILFMTLILFNLLNGLAVSDTQEIRNQAEFNGIICRINSCSTMDERTSAQALAVLNKKSALHI